MPKPHTFPTLFDDVNQLNIASLKKWGYLDNGSFKSGTSTWTSTSGWSGEKRDRGSISMMVDMRTDNPFIKLSYSYQKESRKYKVFFTSLPSNLGNGKLWYFICPKTGKRCRILYLVDGYFFHREAFSGCMYESQTQSKKWRNMEKVYGAHFDSDKCYQELYSKHFKKYYNGKPTKRYLKLKRIIDASERIDYRDIERLMIYGV